MKQSTLSFASVHGVKRKALPSTTCTGAGCTSGGCSTSSASPARWPRPSRRLLNELGIARKVAEAIKAAPALGV